MIIIRRTIFLLFMLLAAGFSFAQSYDINRKYPVEALREDFSLLRNALEKVHPGIYWYSSKDSMDFYFDQTYAQIDEPLTEREFYRLILPLIVQVKCGHTYPDMSNSYYSSDLPKKEYLPFDLYLDKERLFIVKNKSSDSTLAEGDEILKLGKVNVSEIAKRANTLQSADGNNASWKNVFASLFYFEEVYAEYYGGKSPFEITVLDGKGVIRETEVELSDLLKQKRDSAEVAETIKVFSQKSQRKIDKEEREEQEKEKAQLIQFRLTAKDSNAAVLKIAGFSYETVFGVNYKKKHASIFKNIEERQIENLVIDLRGNTGGNLNLVEDLMAYLMDKPFKSISKNELQTTDVNYLKTLSAYFEKSRRGRGFDFKGLKQTSPNVYTFRYFKNKEIKPYKKHRFDGHVYIITDGWVFSAGSVFVSSLRSQRTVTIVGEETGGAAVGCSGGRISRLVLPNTHLRVFFPHFRIYAVTQAQADGHGVIPDYVIKPSLQDVAHGNDPEMKKVFELMKNSHP